MESQVLALSLWGHPRSLKDKRNRPMAPSSPPAGYLCMMPPGIYLCCCQGKGGPKSVQRTRPGSTTGARRQAKAAVLGDADAHLTCVSQPVPAPWTQGILRKKRKQEQLIVSDSPYYPLLVLSVRSPYKCGGGALSIFESCLFVRTLQSEPLPKESGRPVQITLATC